MKTYVWQCQEVGVKLIFTFSFLYRTQTSLRQYLDAIIAQ